MSCTREPHGRARCLRERGSADLAPLWIEELEPADALAELSHRPGPLFRLQEAHFLLKAGREAEARELLESVEELPAGLRRVFDLLRRRAAAARADEPKPTADAGGAGEPVIVSRTLAELYLRQGDREAALSAYRELAARFPDDTHVRERLGALAGQADSPAAPALEAWLAHVRRWRAVRGG